MRSSASPRLFGTAVYVNTDTSREKWGVYLEGTYKVQSTDGTSLDGTRIKAALAASAEFTFAAQGQTMYVNKDASDPNRIAAFKRYDKALAKNKEVSEEHRVKVFRSY